MNLNKTIFKKQNHEHQEHNQELQEHIFLATKCVCEVQNKTQTHSQKIPFCRALPMIQNPKICSKLTLHSCIQNTFCIHIFFNY